MSVDIRSSDRRRLMNELQAREKEIEAGLHKSSSPASPKAQQENDKRMRRQIANSNERRRMQCINAGFQSLRALIPQLEGEKLSKAAILQHTTEYISALEKEKTRLTMQLERTKLLLAEMGQERVVADSYVSNSPPPSKRKKRDTESSDEGVGSLSDGSDEGSSELRQENAVLRNQIEVDRQRCTALEERNRILEAHLMSLLQPQEPVAMTVSGRPMQQHMPEPKHLFKKEVVEVIAAHDEVMRQDYQHRLRPMTPTPDCSLAMETSPPLEPVAPRVVTVELLPKRDTHTPVVVPARAPSVSSAEPTTQSSDRQHHHNYCYRDHPRRRCHQAQLEQQRAEEELRRQQEEQEAAAAAAIAASSYRPPHSTQNLENLVEAIRQIEGDRVLCDERKLYEEEHKLYDRRQPIPNSEESERDTSSMSDQEEHKSESSGRDSPLQQHHQQQQQHVTTISSHRLPSVSMGSSHSSSSSSFSEKYPLATTLLQRPLLSPAYYHRPGVIVHKQ